MTDIHAEPASKVALLVTGELMVLMATVATAVTAMGQQPALSAAAMLSAVPVFFKATSRRPLTALPWLAVSAILCAALAVGAHLGG